MSIIARKATVAIVKMGILEIEGLRFDDNGEYAVAVPQICSLFSIDTNQAARSLKSILGKGLSIDKARTTLHSNPVNCITLLDFDRLITELTIKQNPTAIGFSRALNGLALTQLFSDAFGIKFEKEDRQQYLIKRQTHKEQFHPKFTAWLKKDAGGDSSAVKWGLKVDELKLAAGVPLTFIDEYNPAEYATIDKLNQAYASYHSLRLAGISHEGAIGVLKLQNN